MKKQRVRTLSCLCQTSTRELYIYIHMCAPAALPIQESKGSRFIQGICRHDLACSLYPRQDCSTLPRGFKLLSLMSHKACCVVFFMTTASHVEQVIVFNRWPASILKSMRLVRGLLAASCAAVLFSFEIQQRYRCAPS